jgi:hypothetical protein
MTYNDQRDEIERRAALARAEARMGTRRMDDAWSGWAVPVLIAAVLLAGVAFYAYNGDRMTASNQPSETTGRSESTPPTPPITPPRAQ